MKKFARIIELDNEVEALLYYVYNNEKDEDQVHLKIGTENGGLLSLTFGFSNEEDARSALNERITKDDVQKFYNNTIIHQNTHA